jgi:sulfite reductase beta subunit-like hemoprotein
MSDVNGSPDEGESTGAPSAVERIKLASDGLRGGLREAAVSSTSNFEESDVQLLKFHGVYQQDDRDQRVKRGEPREKAWQMMIRLTIPGGVLTADQYLALDTFADRFGNGTLRLTTRQSIQFHGVLKGNLKALIADVNNALLTTIAACGDVSRNVMASPAPIADEPHRAVQRLAREISLLLRPKTGAYFEIWLDGERLSDSRDDEPVYGPSYLPRKFKVGVAIDTDNSIDIHSYDCGLIAVTEQGTVRGYNLLVGGGFGMTHNKPHTYARIASTIAFVAPDHAVSAVRAVCELYRDEGDRSNRKHGRIKYLVEEWGVDRFIATLRSRVDFSLEPAVEIRPSVPNDFLGVHDQGDGRAFYGLFVQSGRIVDSGVDHVRSAIREIVETLEPGVRLTPTQSVLFTDLEPSAIPIIERILATHGVRTVDALSNTVRYSMACPAMPTCGLALAESERVLLSVLAPIEAELARLDLAGVPLTIRMTGCPNGCARPYNADIGIVGRRPGVYNVFVGGGIRGDRLADLFAADVRIERIPETLRPLLERFSQDRQFDEGLGDFYQRIVDRSEPRRLLTGQETPTAPLLQLQRAT